MRNAALHRQLETYCVDVSRLLCGQVAAGEEIPFELREEPGSGPASLYCYRPLTGRFIRDRRELLTELPVHEQAARALAECEAIDIYLTAHGEIRIPGDRLGRASLALEVLLCAIYEERTDFGFEPAHFETAYAELEQTVYAEHGAATVIVPVMGIALDPDTIELTLGDGVSLMRGEAIDGAPAQAVWVDGSSEPAVLAVLSVHQEFGRGSVPLARTRFRRVLSALRLFSRGAYALGPLTWARTSAGGWRMLATGAGGRGVVGPPRGVTVIAAAQEEELRAFWRLVNRRGGAASGGELAWALARFEMGCERSAPLEALTDHLLALRALLEPEGPASGRLAQRLAVICAHAENRAALARRAARAIDLERAVITGMADGALGGRGESTEALVDELAGHLRAILRDALCGHLDSDLCGLADDLLAEAAEEIEPAGR